jgi:hypothetical protein
VDRFVPALIAFLGLRSIAGWSGLPRVTAVRTLGIVLLILVVVVVSLRHVTFLSFLRTGSAMQSTIKPTE